MGKEVLIDIIKTTSLCIMCFSYGMQYNVTQRARDIARVVWVASLTCVWILAITS